MKKGLVFIATLGALSLGLVACNGGGDDDGKTYTVTITNKDAFADPIFNDDLSKSITVTISDGVITGDAFRSGDLVVTSSNESVLRIQGNNKIVPVAAGESTVKAVYKQKFSDEVKVSVKARPTQRIATELKEDTEYRLAVPHTGGKIYSQAVMATGGAKFYISGTDNFDKAAIAKVTIGSEAEFKYTIKLTDPETGTVKTLGVTSNGSGSSKHYNLGFVGDVVPDTDIPYQEAKFRFNDDYTLSVVCDDKTLYIGGQAGKTTISLGDAVKVVPGHLYEEGDPVPATGVAVSPESLTLAPGEAEQLVATLTPSNSSDNVTWTSSKDSIASVSEKGLVTAGNENGTATITATTDSGKTATCTVKVEGEAMNYGTKESPLTPEQAVAILDKVGDNKLTAQKMFVKGVVTESSQLNSGRRNIWLASSDGATAKYFEFYSCQNTELPDLPTEANALVGYTVVGTGWGTKYVGSSTTYEFTNKDAEGNYDNPEIVIATAGKPAELEGITVSDISVKVGEDADIVVKPVPSNAELGELEYAFKEATQVASIKGNKVHGDAKGEAVLVVSVKGSAIKAEAKVTVKEKAEGDTEVTFNASDLIANPSADYTGGSVQLTSHKIDDVATVSVSGTDKNTGKVYKSNDYGFHIRLYKSGNATISVSVSGGHEIVSATINYEDGTNSWWDAPVEGDMSIAANGLSASFGCSSLETAANIAVYSITISYK